MIPIVINNRNRLTTTRRLVKDLQRLGQQDIYIIDNGSTYPPLLEWYKTGPCNILYYENKGPYALYNIPLFKGYPQIIYTDSDIELNPQTPIDFIETLQGISREYNTPKVGLGLRIDNLPETPYGEACREWEAPNWAHKLEPDIYKASIDTTFSLINPSLPFSYEAIRICYPNMICTHTPWYIDFDYLTAEEQYYIEHANEYSTLKRFYNSDIKPNN